MVFQLRPEDSRQNQYPNAQDVNFLGYDRPSDRWKVDASGIHLYASGISVELDKSTDSVSVWSASGTADLPVYITQPLDFTLEKDTDNVSVWSASGTSDIPVYLTHSIPIEVDLDKDDDSVSVWSASGTSATEVWVNSDISIDTTDPLAVKVVSEILNGAIYDEIDVSRDANGNISSLDYKLDSASQATINVTRNSTGDITNVAVT